VVEWLKLLIRFREIQGSNLGPETGIVMGFLLFLSLSRQILG
jgi:hypothetical protein